MSVEDFLPKIAETLSHGMQNIKFGKIGILFTVHEGRVVSIEQNFTTNIKNRTEAKVAKEERT